MSKMTEILGFNRTMPRWGIFLIDIVICISSILMAYLLRFNFDIPEDKVNDLWIVVPMLMGIRSGIYVLLKTYAGIIHHTSTEDAVKIFSSVAIGSILVAFSNVPSYFISGKFLVPFSVLIIDFIMTIFLMTSFRIMVKALYLELINKEKDTKTVFVLGQGEQVVMTKKALDRDLKIRYKVQGFFIEDKFFRNLKIEGVKVFSMSEIGAVLKEATPDLLIFSDDHLDRKKKDDIVEQCLVHDVEVLNVPPVGSWINGELSFKQIKKVKIEDLLGRDPIELDKTRIEEDVKGKNILVTGAAGSIGSEIVRQLQVFQPKKVYLLDQAESPLYELEIELKEKFKHSSFEVVIADIRSHDRMDNVFKSFNPDIVFHAAAYKHVPLMENNPSEAILTNVFGTKNTAELAVKYGVEKFVLISTDKAVNPTNVMGASKRLAEIYVQSLNNYLGKDKTRFVTTRFGNVLGSNGSVIPLFRKQILSGGPVTVTHPEITRYFMTIPEACQLVLEAGAMGNGGEIFLFDMGESVKIVDLAKKMIKLSGLELGKDIQLTYSGLRPGEKLYEELLTEDENNIPTHHNKIMIGKVREYDYSEVNTELSELVSLFNGQNNLEIVKKMKSLVPEYQSNNSEYEELDKPSMIDVESIGEN